MQVHRKVRFTDEYSIMIGEEYPHEGLLTGYSTISHEVCDSSGQMIWIDMPVAIVEMSDGSIRTPNVKYILFEKESLL